MAIVKYIDPATVIVSGKKALKKGIIIHGYGGNKEEMFGLALNLAENKGLKLLVFDLPGHGSLSDARFNLDSSIDRIKKVIKLLNLDCHSEGPQTTEESETEILRHVVPQDDIFFIGHSIGARLGLIAGLKNGVLISMPGEAFFEGNRKQLIRTLRVRRVNENPLFSGLREIILKEIKLGDNNLLLLADQDLQSVKDLYADLEKRGLAYKTIKGSSHLDIISSHLTLNLTKKWLEELS